jgi:hypothetical protein
MVFLRECFYLYSALDILYFTADTPTASTHPVLTLGYATIIPATLQVSAQWGGLNDVDMCDSREQKNG